MLTAVFISIFLLTAAPNISPLPAQISNQVSPYNFSISRDIISPGSTDDILSDITIAYTLKSKSSVSFKLTQDGKIISNIYEKLDQAPGDYTIIWNGMDEKGGYVSDSLYAMEFYADGNVIKTVPIEVRSLIAKIDVPVSGALVRAQVPIFGIACGRNFKKYFIEYAKQDTPNEWVKIEESTISKADKTQIQDLAIGDETLHGNLATWDTGLKEYYYYDTDVDLSGSYILRLTVFDEKGNKAADEVNVDIGTIVSFVYGGMVASPDEKVRLTFEEHSLKTPFMLFNIKEAPASFPKSLVEKEGYKSASSIYEIEPEGINFGRPASLAMSYNLDRVKNDARIAIYAYDSDLRTWECLPGARDKKGRVLIAKLAGTKRLYAYYVIFERLKDIEAPRLYDLSKETRFNIMDISGEAEPGQRIKIYVNGKEAGEAASDKKTGVFKLSQALLDFGRNKITARAVDEFGDVSLASNIVTVNSLIKSPKRITKPLLPPELRPCRDIFEFGNTPYNAEKYPIVSFDYKISQDVKINFLVKAGKRWYDVQFTDDPKTYERINMVKIGKIDNVIRDNEWHHAGFNLYNMLKRYTGNKVIERMIMANYDVTGFMKLCYGRNPEGAVFYIDNFAVSKSRQKAAPREKSQTSWEIGDNDNSNDEFLYEKEVGDDYYAGGPIEDFERAVAKADPKTNIRFYLSKKDLRREYNFFIKANDWDVRGYNYVDFDVLLNNRKIASLKCPYKDGTVFNIKIDKNLKEGENVLTLEWTGGGDWISWDYLRFEPQCDIKKSSANWEIGYDDGSFKEFSHEMDISDDYIVGEDFKKFERAISVQDPITNIRFYLSKDMLNNDYELFIKPFDIQPIDSQPKMSGAFFKVLVNNEDNGAYNVTSAKEPLRVRIPGSGLKEGENIISLEWLAGCDWIMWDYLKFNPVEEDEKL